jgi:hypothetical protein
VKRRLPPKQKPSTSIYVGTLEPKGWPRFEKDSGKRRRKRLKITQSAKGILGTRPKIRISPLEDIINSKMSALLHE